MAELRRARGSRSRMGSVISMDTLRPAMGRLLVFCAGSCCCWANGLGVDPVADGAVLGLLILGLVGGAACRSDRSLSRSFSLSLSASFSSASSPLRVKNTVGDVGALSSDSSSGNPPARVRRNPPFGTVCAVICITSFAENLVCVGPALFGALCADPGLLELTVPDDDGLRPPEPDPGGVCGVAMLSFGFGASRPTACNAAVSTCIARSTSLFTSGSLAVSLPFAIPPAVVGLCVLLTTALASVARCFGTSSKCGNSGTLSL